MGIGKWIVGGVCAVGAVIAAPVVLPVAAAAAATAGTAVAGAAAAAGTAVAGAAAAAGTAVVGGMAAVGSTVGTAAGAVGLASVATVAGTTAGAAAVGTIATAGAVGIASTGVGAKKMIEAKEIVDRAESKYSEQKKILDKEESATNKSIERLGILKGNICEGFIQFYDVITKVKNCNIISADAKDEELRISKEELDNLKAMSFKVTELLGVSAGSIGVGALTGLAVYGGTMAIGTASTGAAIAGLSGVAATNATLASFGGGAIAAGGLGMAGGTAVLGGLVAAPALAVGGIFLAFKGNESVEKAYEVEKKANTAVKQMNLSIDKVKEIKKVVTMITLELNKLNKNFHNTLEQLKKIVEEKQDFNKFTSEEIEVTEKSVLIVKILKKIITTDLLIKKGEEQVVDEKNIELILEKAKSLN